MLKTITAFKQKQTTTKKLVLFLCKVLLEFYQNVSDANKLHRLCILEVCAVLRVVAPACGEDKLARQCLESGNVKERAL